MAYIVTVEGPTGVRFPLRGIVVAYHMDRAEKFQSRSNAELALQKAKKFMKAETFKTARIEQVD
jgi:hypothetical protein